MKRKHLFLVVLAMLALLCAFPAFGGPESGEQEDTASVSSPAKLEDHFMETSQLKKFQYLLYAPANATENMPLIVYLHGHGLGDKMSSLRNESLFKALRERDGQLSNAYILAPLLPPELDLGVKGMWPGISDSLMELINKVAEERQIDRSRISIIGSSMGGDSALQLAAKYPGTFSCVTGVVPFHYKCPIRAWDDSWAVALKDVPAWFFIEDEGDAKSMAEQATNAIIAAGGQAWTEIQKNADHNRANTQVVGSRAAEIYDWMVSVRRPE